MADRIVSVQHLTASAAGSDREISIPDYNAPEYKTSDAVMYVFDGSNTSEIELCQESGSTEGLKIAAGVQSKSGPWRLIGGPPKYLYASGSVDVRVTVVLVR